MKCFALVFVLCGLCAKTRAQNNFQSSSPYTGKIVNVNGNDIMLPSYNASAVKIEGSSYFSKDWVKGSVTTTDNVVFSKNLLFMYDKTNNELYYKARDSSVTYKVDREKILAFNLITNHPHIFMKADFFDKDHAGEFFEVLVLDEKKYSLLKYVKAIYEENATSKASQAMTENFSNGRYVDNVKYFLFKNGAATEVMLKKKKFEEVLGVDFDKAEAYLKNHNGSFNEEAAIGLLTEINEQLN